MMSTMVTLTNTAIGRDGCREEYYNPYDIARVEPWRTGPEDHTVLGARVTLDDHDDTVIYVAQTAEEVTQRIDAARAAINSVEVTEYRVRVTNWMGQVWVLLVANFFINLLTHWWGAGLHSIFVEYTFLDPYWWLP